MFLESVVSQSQETTDYQRFGFTRKPKLFHQLFKRRKLDKTATKRSLIREEGRGWPGVIMGVGGSSFIHCEFVSRHPKPIEHRVWAQGKKINVPPPPVSTMVRLSVKSLNVLGVPCRALSRGRWPSIHLVHWALSKPSGGQWAPENTGCVEFKKTFIVGKGKTAGKRRNRGRAKRTEKLEAEHSTNHERQCGWN